MKTTLMKIKVIKLSAIIFITWLFVGFSVSAQTKADANALWQQLQTKPDGLHILHGDTK